MISKKVFVGNSIITRFLSDFIIRSEQFTRVYNYMYDINGVEGSIDPTSGLFVRVVDIPNSADIVTIDKWDLVDNSISFYVAPFGGSRIYIEVATTPEEFGDTLVQPSVERAEEAAIASAASAIASATSESAALGSQTAAAGSAAGAATSEFNASSSASGAATSASNSANSANNSATSAVGSASSASASSGSAAAADISAAESAGSATASAGSATASASSAGESAASAAAALASENAAAATLLSSVLLDGTRPMTGNLEAPSISIGGATVDIDNYGIIRGSNSNGEYTKYPDGTLVCHIRNKVMLYSNISNMFFNWTFPHAFIAVPTLQVTCEYTTFSSAFREAQPLLYARDTTNIASTIGMASNSLWVSGDELLGDNINGMAIGRWK